MDAFDLPFLYAVIGRQDSVSWWQMAIRAVLLFVWGLLLVRLAGKRAIGQKAAFDTILAVIIGSMLSRAVTGDAPFLATALGTAVLVALHALLARLTYVSQWVGHLVKGKPAHLVHDGRLLEEAMADAKITEHDLIEAARKHGLEGLDPIKEAYIERGGEISVIPR